LNCHFKVDQFKYVGGFGWIDQFKYEMVKKKLRVEMEKICMVSGIEGFEIDEILDALLFLYILFMQVVWCSG
jgi:hypothetical protein